MNDNFKPIDKAVPQDVLDFWFAEGSQANWWQQSDVFDNLIRSKFLDLWQAACEGHLDNWMDTPEGALALIIILDQFSRNLNRNSADAYANDARALVLTDIAIKSGMDMVLEPEQRRFIYMPLEHSENLQDQIDCLSYMKERVGDGGAIVYAEKHLEVIEKFGRFPHRNKVMNRTSTMAELAWLDQKGGF